jgi:Fic family protein
MNQKNCKILPQNYYSEYSEKVGDLSVKVLQLADKEVFTPNDFDHYIVPSAVFSSNIEGNSLDVDTFLKNRHFNIKSKPKETAEILDLIAAYNFAVTMPLTKQNFLKSHLILSETILSLKKYQGKLRKEQVGIFSGGKIEYMAVEPEYVKIEFEKLFSDIQLLLNEELSVNEIFYFASMIHLIFEKIHPFMDGNGRVGRLLEKWFLASFLGVKAWSIASEKYYMQNRTAYYENIHIGLNYYVLKWERAMPFLTMLPKSI